MQRSSLLEIRELDRQILLELDDASLNQACQINQWLHQICQDDFFWRQRTLLRYGPEILGWKPVDETYRQQYQRLSRLPINERTAWHSVITGNVDELILLQEHGVLANPRNLMNRAARAGQLGVLEWFVQQGYALPPRLEEYAGGGGQISVLEWLLARGILPSQEGMRFAAAAGYLPTLQWYLQHGVVPNADMVRSAVANGHFEVLQWLMNHGAPPPRNLLNIALSYGQLEIAEYLTQRYPRIPPPTQGVVDHVAKMGYLPTLIWLRERGFTPNPAVIETVEDIIQYLTNREQLSPQRRQEVNTILRERSSSFPTDFWRRVDAPFRTWEDAARYLTPAELQEILQDYQETLAWLRAL